ncbi:PREDICTED: protein transport protein Sec31A isoform X2 [Rhagoletis zephyria]|uniref:protein transport protein Sec31A isoform X2 n=1 Tax=Rhagoletis zephyria TaxID=28612 RepID=UPI0008112207|nr:PREDICTED: protein transport protein Sec31A isoform X2 [Rhagoletis zephyria]
MKVKELQKTVNIAWSPLPQYPIYLAAGSAAQQLDSNVNPTLEIYSTNFSDPSYDLELKASLPSQYRFQKVIWSPTGYDGAHSNGLIVGGCEGGHVMIYSAAKMLANEEGLIARQDKHSGPVSGLDVNPFQTNLLASCASESEIFIWDLNNTTTHMNPGTKTQPLEDVQNVAWNRQVQHILASVFSSRCVIWDLRKSEQIIKLSDTQSRVRWHAIQWHPDVATQVWLASEDDQAPVVQLWDLRYATAPAKTMQIHQRGVLGMSWCPRDVDLMVSCGKDNHIYCWNPNTELPEGEILSEVAATATWYSDVQWCPRNPALVASASLDGNVSIYSLFGGTQQQVQTSNKIADSFPGMDQLAQAPIPQQSTQIVYHDLKRAPKWIKRPCGVTFGFGGKLVHFNGKSNQVQVSQVVTEPELVERANVLERSLNEANYVDYCRQRADQMTDQNGRYLWYFIKANFELNPKEELLNLLGFNKDDIDGKFAKFVKEDETLQNDVDQVTNRLANLSHSDSSEVECDQSTDGSTDISQPVDNNAIFDGIAASQKQQQLDNENLAKPAKQFIIPKDPDSLITEAILTGNLEAAVELCLDSHRTAEALIIASTAGIDFLTKIHNRYLQQQRSELSNVISALVTRDWLDFVNRCTVDSWKEALVAALKHSDRKVVDICERLGDRLLEERAQSIDFTRNAMLCYVCAGSIDKLVTAWHQLKALEHQNDSYKPNTAELQELAEIVMLMSKSLDQQGIALELNGRFADFITEYGGLLVAQGALTAALAYIYAFGSGNNDQNVELVELRDRIYNTVNYRPAAAQGSGRLSYQQQQPQNIYSRQQQQQPQNLPAARGSFSHALPQTMGGYVGTGATNQFAPTSAGNWNTPPGLSQPGTAAAVSQQPVPTLFNPVAPAVPAPAAAKPPLPGAPVPAHITNDALHSQPPRPVSNASSQGGSSGNLHSRSKYVLDPSVASAGGYGGGGYQPLAPAPALAPATMPTFNASLFNAPITATPGQPSLMQPAAPFNAGAPYGLSGGNNYNAAFPGDIGSQQQPLSPQQQQPPPPAQNLHHNPTPPPGWNDPPALKSTRANKKPDPASASAPITHPLFGVDPNQNQNQNGYMDPYNQYQNPGMPPPPTSSNSNLLNPMQGAGPGAYYNPTQAQNNNMPTQQFPQQINFQTSAIPQQQQQQQQPWNTQTQNMGYTEQPAPVQREPEPPKEKPPLPEEYIYLQTVLEELKNQCLAVTTDPRTKRKFVDVTKRLENLYDCLRDDRLNPATITALNQIVQFVQVGDYANALQTQTQIAFGSDFSQCAGFMPGLKVLVQSAADLQVYLR